MFKSKIAVLMGGASSEREVSLVSGKYCFEALEKAGHSVFKINVTDNIEKLVYDLKAVSPDIALNMLHGTYGEDGRIQSLLEMMKIPYSHSGVLASSLAMDKQKTKEILSLQNIPCPKGKIITKSEYLNAVNNQEISIPYVIKPNSEGSSFGVYIVMNDKDEADMIKSDVLDSGIRDMIIEEYIPGREMTVAVIGDKALGVTEIVPDPNIGGSFYDYAAKYAEGGSKHILPADIPDDIYKDAKDYALKAHDALGCNGVTRTDFRYNDTTVGKQGLYFLEINTQPGMTPTSLVPEQAKYKGMSFTDLVIWMIENPVNKFMLSQVENEQKENQEKIA